MNNGAPRRHRICYDGHCPVCIRTAKWVKKWDRSDQFELESVWDSTARDSATASSPDEITLVLNDGTVHGGWDAVCLLLRHHPYLSWLGHIGAWPGIRALGRSFYRWFARHRHQISRLTRDT